jgi:plastocyanin
MAKLRIALVVLVLGALFAACGGSDDGGSASNDTETTKAGAAGPTIQLKDLKFDPDELTIEKGQTVTWEWKESVLHNVTGDGFKSENESDGTFTHTFTKPGTYDYQCTLHSGMKGKVTVS